MNDSRSDPADFLPLTDLCFHILLALGAGASHGYAIGKDIERRSSGRLNPATGSLYQALRRLHRDGLIEEVQQPRRITVDDARRQYFRLTPFGRRVFALEAQRLETLLLSARELKLVPS
ncbi:MAG: helix-turn-helix transcriptional regulator [Gemmatimonadota bacterium]|nr:MAG: helix-turn-helix transcriptional regulator [Gemmatimonadota bacterium]